MTKRGYFDVIVVGGGPAGLATAINLKRRHQLSVLVLTKVHLAHSVGEVMPPIIKEELTQLGVYEAFIESGPIASDGVSTWLGEGGRREWDYIFDPHGYGWHVDRRSFEGMLGRVVRCLGVEILKIQRIDISSAGVFFGWHITVINSAGMQQKFETAFVVNAAGRSNRLSHITGRKTHHDHLIGCYQYVFGTHPRGAWERRLWIESTPNGWFYSAPLPGETGVVVFLTDSDLIRGDISTFVRDQVVQAPNTLSRLCQATPKGPMRLCSARSGIVPKFRHPNAVTVGDASYTSDPIRGHGILQSMRQAHEVCDLVLQYLSGNSQSTQLYHDALKGRYGSYFEGLSGRYALENRWCNNTFWKRRTTLTANQIDFGRA